MQWPSERTKTSDWVSLSTDMIEAVRKRPDYPCTFASKARLFMRNVAEYPSAGTIAFEPLPDILCEYLAALKALDDERTRAYFLLIVVFKPEPCERSIAEYQSYFWNMMRLLRARDATPWPSSIPNDPDNALWSFCFGGIPIFVNANSPAHVRRRSRNLGQSFVVIFQPRAGLDHVAPLDSSGDRIRDMIRGRLDRYDVLPAYSGLTTYGTAENRDWTLYFLPDDDSLNVGKCPMASSPE